jgi:hypothetical protein
VKKSGLLIGLIAGFAVSVGCQQVDRAVKGIQAPGGEWQRLGESRYDTRSDVEYLGASADGAIIVRTPDGRAQIWKR